MKLTEFLFWKDVFISLKLGKSQANPALEINTWKWTKIFL